MLQALALDELTPAQAQYVSLARSSGESLLSLLNDVLALSKAGSLPARAIRALPGPASRTPLLALTAASAEEDRATCLAAGMEDVLLKPVRRADLRAVLDGLPR